jgi:hypothetical protein
MEILTIMPLRISIRYFIRAVLGEAAALDRRMLIADREEPHRHVGEALFPKHKPLDFLLARKKIMTQASWESEYQQQHPIVVGGGIFPIEKMTTVPHWSLDMVVKSVRYWDKAGTEDGDAHTAGVLMHKINDGRFVIEHVVRGQWSALDRERQSRATGTLPRERLRMLVIGTRQSRQARG